MPKLYWNCCASVCLCFWQTGASSDYYKRDRTRNLQTRCAKVFIEKESEKRPRDALKLLREQDRFRSKRHCLSTSLWLQAKAT